MSLQGKTVLVVGGATGIGFEVAKQAVKQGANVVIASRGAEALEQAKQHVNGLETFLVDVGSERSIELLEKSVGAVDHLVVTVKPALPKGPAFSQSVDTLSSAFETKVWGALRLVGHLRSNLTPEGSITLTSGVAAKKHFDGFMAASVMNAATEAMAKSLAVEMAPIRVNVVSPGFVHNHNHPRAEDELPNLILKREAQANEVAQAYLFLMKNGYTTGTVVSVEGGVAC